LAPTRRFVPPRHQWVFGVHGSSSGVTLRHPWIFIGQQQPSSALGLRQKLPSSEMVFVGQGPSPEMIFAGQGLLSEMAFVNDDLRQNLISSVGVFVS